ncbi:hypothetical protein ACV356_27545 [Pseudomonas aeruginosa]
MTLEFKPADKREVDGNGYQNITLRANNIEGFCADSFARAFARNLIGSKGKASLIVTIDKLPVLNMVYDKEKRSCEKEYALERNLTGYEIVSSAKKEYQVNVIFVSSEKYETVQNLVAIGRKVLKPVDVYNQLLAVVSEEDLQDAAAIFDGIVSASASTADNHNVVVRLPASDGSTQLTMTARIGKVLYTPLVLELNPEESLLQKLQPGIVMETKLDTQDPIGDVLLNRRSTERLVFKEGDLATIDNECDYLKEKYRGRLNERDVQKLLESYLYEEHRGSVNKDVIEACLWPIHNPDRELMIGYLANHFDDNDGAKSGRDTNFLDYLIPGQAATVLVDGATFYDQEGDLKVSDIAGYVALKKGSVPLCHRFIKRNQVGYMQVIDGRAYYLKAQIDQEYTKEEAESGKLSRIKFITASRIIDPEYEGVVSTKQCLSTKKQKYVLVSSN